MSDLGLDKSQVDSLDYSEHEILKKYDEQEEFLKKGFATLINQCSRENESNTPDFILAEYLYDCLVSYEYIHNRNEAWYGKQLKII